MVAPWVIPQEEQLPQEGTPRNPQAALDAILPRAQSVKFSHSKRFNDSHWQSDEMPKSIIEPVYEIHVPTIKFGKPPNKKEAPVDTRDILSVDSVERSMAAVLHRSPRASMGRAARASGALSAAAGPGPGHYDVGPAADRATPSRPPRAQAGSGVAPFGCAPAVIKHPLPTYASSPG